jgi:hypothetical protein
MKQGLITCDMLVGCIPEDVIQGILYIKKFYQNKIGDLLNHHFFGCHIFIYFLCLGILCAF